MTEPLVNDAAVRPYSRVLTVAWTAGKVLLLVAAVLLLHKLLGSGLWAWVKTLGALILAPWAVGHYLDIAQRFSLWPEGGWLGIDDVPAGTDDHEPVDD